MALTITFEDLPPLTTVCNVCKGTGHTSNFAKGRVRVVTCVSCTDGQTPTKFGLALMEFLDKYGGKKE